MKCSKCHEYTTIKDTEEFLTIKCKCEMIIIYPDKFIVRKDKKEYDPKYKEK
jgi:hypothetical protein